MLLMTSKYFLQEDDIGADAAYCIAQLVQNETAVEDREAFVRIQREQLELQARLLRGLGHGGLIVPTHMREPRTILSKLEHYGLVTRPRGADRHPAIRALTP